MPVFVPFLSITIVVLSTGEELGPYRDIQNNRHCRNATISFGQWTGGVLQLWNGSSGKTGIPVTIGQCWMHEALRIGFRELMGRECRQYITLLNIYTDFEKKTGKSSKDAGSQ